MPLFLVQGERWGGKHTVSHRQALASSQQLSSMLWEKRARGEKSRMSQSENDGGGTHRDEINVQEKGATRGRKKKSLISYQNTGSNLAVASHSNCVSRQLPCADHKQGFAVAG